MKEMKDDMIKSKANEELLTQENKLLKQQEGEDEEVMLLSSEAKNTLMDALLERLGQTWDKSLTQMSSMKEEVVEKAKQKREARDKTKEEELKKYKDEAAKWRKAFEDASTSASPSGAGTKEGHWKKEAKKYQEQARVVEKRYQDARPTEEYVNLVRDTVSC